MSATDGASLRHKRIMDMLQYIHSCNGLPMVQIQAYMLSAHGLKFRTTADYVKECCFAHFIRTDGALFRVDVKKVKLEGEY